MVDVSKFNASNRNLMHLEEEEEKMKYKSIFPDLACGPFIPCQSWKVKRSIFFVGCH